MKEKVVGTLDNLPLGKTCHGNGKTTRLKKKGVKTPHAKEKEKEKKSPPGERRGQN